MTLSKPFLAIARLVVVSGGVAVYDQVFREGVNIIRGANSSGKSTIADFIFFVLGGDFNAWKLEAERCDSVFCEVRINDNSITLRRDIAKDLRQPMTIFWGAYELARASAVEGWQSYSFQRSANKDSFSQALFRALEFPEVKGDFDSNITMHQILRLLYVDQISPVDALMRSESFDSPLTRATVGELLFGVFEDTIYSEELSLRMKQRASEDMGRQIDSLLQVLGETEQETEIAEAELQIQKLQAQLARVDEAILSTKTLLADEQKLSPQGLEEMQLRVANSRFQWLQSKSDAEQQALEIEDSKEFIVVLNKRLSALDESMVTRAALGELPLTQCPHCLSSLVPLSASDSHSCVLCRQPLAEDSGHSQALRMRQEIALQIKESLGLLEAKEKRLSELSANLSGLKYLAETEERHFRTQMSSVKTRRDQDIDALYQKKGTLETSIEYLHKQAKAAALLEGFKMRKARLTAEIQSLEFSIRGRRQRQTMRLAEAQEHIEAYTLALLKRDLPREDWFSVAQSVSLSFSKNTFAVDGRNQFSASSMTYLKNSVRFAILFASLDLPYFRYPRFILCDNIEDKGMEEARSKNFQKAIVELSQSFEVRHQIIFTTSMIEPELDTVDCCIGPKYNKQHHTLQFATVESLPSS